MKTITTIVTSYNHREFIAQALDSAIAQTGDFSHEILVADDASTDGTADIVRDYAKRHPDLIKDISHLKNLGISANLKRAFGLASGEYIAILEGDDYWTDDRKLEKQMSFLGKNSDCPMVFSRIRLKSGDTFSTLARHDNLPEKIGSGDLLACEWKNPICNFSCCLFRKESVVALPEVAYEHRLSEMSVAFFLVQLGPIGYMRETMSVYRLHDRGTFSAADDLSKWEQALHSFMTVRKVAGQECWGPLTKDIEGIKQKLSEARSKGKPRLSIVTITYNNLGGLKKTAESVARQTCTDFEWIVVDGGSKDGSVEFLRQFGRSPDILISERDNGVYDAMNKGVNQAKGEYCICMNAGDAFRDAHTLEQAFAHGFSADVVYGNWVRKYLNGREMMCYAPPELPPLFFFRPQSNICQQAMFVRTRVLQASNFDTSFKIYADWAKWRQLMLDGCSFQYIPLVVCDFEAETGLSEKVTSALLDDAIRLQAAFSEGVLTQAAIAQDWAEASVAETARLNGRIAEADETIGSLHGELERVRGELAAVCAERAAWKAGYDGISTSTCWKLTKPVRWVLDKLKNAVGKPPEGRGENPPTLSNSQSLQGVNYH